MHFISGLPRSGSTLLAAILKQNPRFTAGMTSPVSTIYRYLEAAMSQANESAVFVTDDLRKRVLRGVFDSAYPEHDGTVFDTSRLWAARLPALSHLFPDAKIVCCVRDISWIMDSFECLHARNPFEPSGIYNYDTGGTVYSRCNQLAHNGPVGYSLDALREALAGEHADMVLLVEYDDLCRATAETIEEIYAFIGEPLFQHDFENVKYSASDFDRNIGAPGLHDVGGRVERRWRKTILPPDLFARYANDQFWRAPSTPHLGLVKQ